MIITCVSDLHGCFPTLLGGHLLIVAGDLTGTNRKQEYDAFCDWIEPLPYQMKVVVAGNHDTFIQGMDWGQKFAWSQKGGFEYLQDSMIQFEGLRIYGSPWTKKFPMINPSCTAFTVDQCESLQDKWGRIPDDIDILVTHVPAMGILDDSELNGRFGDPDLEKCLRAMNKPPLLHVFGHIHDDGGKIMVCGSPGRSWLAVNAAYMNDEYMPENTLVRLRLEDR